MNWLQYLLEANLYLGVFYLCYCLFLNRETYYMLNRVYLLAVCVISFIIPVIQLGILKPTVPLVQTDALMAPVNLSRHNSPAAIAPAASHFSLQDGLLYLYLLGTAVFVIVLVIKLYHLIKLTGAKPLINHGDYKLVYINGANTAFSFFNYLFIGTTVSQKETIIRHELVHIRQKHSVDIILLELFKIVNWFNPLVYLLQNSLKTVHEYIADEKTALAEVDALTYSAFLVNNAYGLGGSSVTHSFFNYNLLKKRIIMLNQQRSGSLARLKYLLALPVCVGLLCTSTLAFSKNYGWVDIAPPGPLPANHVPKIKTLKSTSGNIVDYGDKMIINDKTYTVNTLTETEKAYLLKTYHIKLEMVEIDGKPGQATLFFPTIGAKGKAGDSTKVESSYTSNGYKFKETGYLINNKPNFRVLITEKNGAQKAYFRNSATASQIKLLKDKYGYKFPSMDIYSKMPPPPPAPMGPPPPPAPPQHKQVKFNKPTQPFYSFGQDSVYVYCDKQPVFPGGLEGFTKYLAKNIKYPEAARKNKIQGRVILRFIVRKDGSITDVNLLRGVDPEIDKEAALVLSAMPKWQPGINKGKVVSCQYTVPVAFAL